MNLAKAPASTIQILGAEKALFRALKTKHDTPKYGLIYHASLVGQTNQKNKGKISRVLAAKTALSIRVDALGDSSEATIALDGRNKVESRMRQLEGGARASTSHSSARKPEVLSSSSSAVKNSDKSSSKYNASSDFQDVASSKKRKRDEEEPVEEEEEEVEVKSKSKKEKKEKKEKKHKSSHEDEE